MDRRKNEANTVKQESNDTLHGKTILSFISPYKTKENEMTEHDLSLQETPVKEAHFKIRIASSGERLSQVNQLINNGFSLSEDSATYFNLNKTSGRMKLIVTQDVIGIATITLILDDPLDLEKYEPFKSEVDRLRNDGKRLAEVTNLVVIEGSDGSERLRASIIHVAYIYARRIYNYTDFIIEVIQRHSKYYEKMLGFKCFGPERPTSWTNGPTVLLRLDLDYMGEQIMKLGGTQYQPNSGEKSLYRYFFSKEDEAGITQRLMRGG
jgi:hypothetical protein